MFLNKFPWCQKGKQAIAAQDNAVTLTPTHNTLDEFHLLNTKSKFYVFKASSFGRSEGM